MVIRQNKNNLLGNVR